MLTIWGKKILSVNSSWILPSYNNPIYNIKIIDALGNTRYTNGKCTYNSSMGLINETLRSVTGSSSQWWHASNGIAIGSGSTLPTENDYTLVNQIIGFNTSSPSNVAEIIDNQIYRVTLQWPIQNTSENDMTIREVGIFRSIYSGGSYREERAPSADWNLARAASVMIDRTLLDNEVVIPAGETGTVKYIFDYPFSEV